MPYIKAEDRIKALDKPGTSGELNFAITALINDYLWHRGPGLRYAALNDAIGALECAKLELYRRVVAPYENTKIAENGDVYDASILP
jgi:hypothetical protein